MKTYKDIEISCMELFPFNTKTCITCKHFILESNNNEVVLYKSITYNNCTIENIDFKTQQIHIVHHGENYSIPFEKLTIYNNIIYKVFGIKEYFEVLNS